MTPEQRAELAEIADALRHQGDCASRAGQYDDLYDLAERLDALIGQS